MNTNPVKKNNLTSQVIESLKEYIISEKLKYGDKLPSERELSEVFAVSRNVIRESTRALESVGLVYKIQGKGIYIGKFHSEKILSQMVFGIIFNKEKQLEVIEIRRGFEKAVMKILINKVTDEQINFLKNFIEEINDIDIKSLKDVKDYDLRFHLNFLYLLDNPIVERFGSVLNEYFKYSLKKTKTPISKADIQKEKNFFIEKHKIIISALVKRDINACRIAIDEHYYE